MDILSASKINRFQDCPFSFYCRYVGRRQTITTPDSFSFGSMVHDIIPDYYSRLSAMDNIDGVKRKIESSFVEGTDWRLGKRKQALRDCETNFTRFEERRIRDKRGLPTFTEKKLKAKLFPELPEVEGIIDAYWGDKGGLWVDWKTSKYEEMTNSRMVQGKTYELLLIANDYPVKKGMFVNLLRGVNHALPRVSDAWLETKVRETLTAIDKDRFTIRPSGLCDGWCEYKLDCDLQNEILWKSLLEI